MIDTHVTLLQALTFLVSAVLPLIVGYVTTTLTSSKYQALLLALLAAITGFVSEWISDIQTGLGFSLWTAIFTWLTSFVVAVATHYGFWNPTGVSAWLLAHGYTYKGEHETRK